MKKLNTKIKATLVAGLMVCSNFVFANQDEINDIALAMLVDTPMVKSLNLKQIKVNDTVILKRFKKLSTSQKYDVLNIVRNANLKKNSIGQDQNALLIQRSVGVVMRQLESQDIFIGDLPDSQIKSLIVEVQKTL